MAGEAIAFLPRGEDLRSEPELTSAGFKAQTAATRVAGSSAKNAATYGDDVKSSSRVGAPWCCISANHSKSSSAAGGCARNWWALRLKTRKIRCSCCGQARGSIRKSRKYRERALSRGHSALQWPRKAQFVY